MEKLRVIICDANKQEREGYSAICRSICEQSDVPAEVKVYADGSDLLFDIGDDAFVASVGIVVVDPEDGFVTIPSTLRQRGYDGVILYISHANSAEHYRQAFDVCAYNFVQKGADEQSISRFQSVFESALERAQRLDRRFMAVSYAGEYRRIEVKDILYFKTEKADASHLVTVVYVGGSFKFISTMQRLEKRLSNDGFVRTHRSYLVSCSAIHRVTRDGIILSNGYKISVSQERVAAVKAALLCW